MDVPNSEEVQQICEELSEDSEAVDDLKKTSEIDKTVVEEENKCESTHSNNITNIENDQSTCAEENSSSSLSNNNENEKKLQILRESPRKKIQNASYEINVVDDIKNIVEC